jgi:hypothetical protein
VSKEREKEIPVLVSMPGRPEPSIVVNADKRTFAVKDAVAKRREDARETRTDESCR